MNKHFMKVDSNGMENDFSCERFAQFLNDYGTRPVTP